MIVADDRRCRAGARIDAVKGHQIQTLCHLLCETIRESFQNVHLVLLGSVQEFIRHAGTVLDLQRQNGDGIHGRTALGLGTVLSHNVHFLVQREGELLHAIERNGRCAAELRQRGCAGGLLDEAGHQLGGKQGTFAQNIRHCKISFSRCSSAGW